VVQSYCGLRRFAIRARTTLPAAEFGAPKHSEAGITTLSKTLLLVNATRYAIEAALKTLGIAGIVLVWWQDKVQSHSAVLSESPLD